MAPQGEISLKNYAAGENSAENLTKNGAAGENLDQKLPRREKFRLKIAPQAKIWPKNGTAGENLDQT